MCGCSKEVGKEEFIDDAVVKSTNYKPSYTTTSFILAGKAVVPIVSYHPPEYKIEIEYKGITYKKNNKEYYKQLNGKLNHKIKCKFIKTYYDDNTSKIDLLEMGSID